MVVGTTIIVALCVSPFFGEAGPGGPRSVTAGLGVFVGGFRVEVWKRKLE